MGYSLPSGLQLPRGWPRRCRSAAVYAISVADLAFTKTPIWAATASIPGFADKQLERLRREIALLREEVRIRLDLSVQSLAERQHLPVITLKRDA